MLAAGGLLGRDVGRRAQELTLGGQGRFVGVAVGQAEVHQPGPVRAVEEDVGRLDVAVNDALLVGVVQGVGHVGQPADCLGRRRPTGGEDVLQRFPLDELADEVETAARLAEVVDGGDVRVAQAGGTAGLAQQAARSGCWEPPPWNSLTATVRCNSGVAAAVDRAETAAADDFEQLVLAEGGGAIRSGSLLGLCQRRSAESNSAWRASSSANSGKCFR